MCPTCQTAWPEALRLQAEATLAHAKVGRPVLLTIGMYVAPTFGGIALLVALSAAFDLGAYSINGEAVSGPEFLLRAGVFYVAFGASALAAAYAIWQERSWSRWAIVVFWLAQLAAAVGFGWAESGIAEAARRVTA